MIIRLGGWLQGENRVFEGEDPDALAGFHDSLVRITGPVRYNLAASLAGNELLVRGSLSVEVSARCSRCGEWTASCCSEPKFLRSIPIKTLHDVINLTEDIREDTLLSFPSNFVCSPSCKGLCLVCGANLNHAACSCLPKQGRDEWQILDKWLKDRPEGRPRA